MKQNPRIKRSFALVAHGPNVVELRQGVWNTVAFTLTDDGGQGKLYEVLKSLDGTQGTARIAKDHGMKTAEIEALVDHLDNLSVLEDGPTSALDYYLSESISSLRAVGDEPQAVERVVLLGDALLTAPIQQTLTASLRELPVELPGANDSARVVFETASAEALLKGLDYEAAVSACEPWRDALVVFAQSTLRPDRLTVLNRLARGAGFRWMNVALDGAFLLVGPTFDPMHGPCYECLDTRVLMNVRDSFTYQDYKNALHQHRVKHGDMPVLPAIANVLAAHAALEICNLVVAGANFTSGQLLSIYLPTMAFVYHEVLQVPGCSGCGASSERDDPELYFDLRALAGG